MAIPAILFGAWAMLDVILYATTGNDSIYYVADALGWVDHTVPAGDTLTIISGMDWMDAIVENSIPLTILLLVVFCVFYFSTTDINSNGE